MGSGREGGSPTPAMASVSAAKQVVAVSSSMLTHKLQREELLEGGSSTGVDTTTGKKNPNLNGRSRTPRAGNTPLHSPRSMSPLRGLSSTEMAASEIASATLVDFQEAILRANIAQKTILPRADDHCVFGEDAMDFETQKAMKRADSVSKEALTPTVTISKAEIAHAPGVGQQLRSKSPFPPSRTRAAAAENMDQQAPVPLRSTRRAEAANAPPSEWVLLERGKSPRRSKVSSSTTLLEAQDALLERRSSRTSRKSKVEAMEELPDADLGMGDTNRVTRRSHTRPHTRQHKRKATDSVTGIAGAVSPPDNYIAQRSPLLPHRQEQVIEYNAPPYRVERHSGVTSSPTSFTSRRATREARMVATSDWLQFLGDIIMWRHIPRSSLLFGAGCFCIMSASLIQDMQYSMFSVMAYMALFYLAARFIKCNFVRGSTSTLSIGLVTEADALRLIRIVLPPFNLILQKLGDLFSGEPIVTLKVAGALWLLARAGSMMDPWTLARIGYFALFTVPKCYSSYHEQIETQARNVLHWIRNTWSACGHKRVVVCAAFLVAWNFSSVSTRVCGAFLALVGVRAYRHVLQNELDTGSTFFNQERLGRMGG